MTTATDKPLFTFVATYKTSNKATARIKKINAFFSPSLEAATDYATRVIDREHPGGILLHVRPTADPRTQKTLTIAGHELTLTVGRRYRASRRMASSMNRGANFPVKITDITERHPLDASNAHPAALIEPLSYDEANELLTAFNNGQTSFEGRIWE